jgi:hypothetical protein
MPLGGAGGDGASAGGTTGAAGAAGDGVAGADGGAGGTTGGGAGGDGGAAAGTGGAAGTGVVGAAGTTGVAGEGGARGGAGGTGGVAGNGMGGEGARGGAGGAVGGRGGTTGMCGICPTCTRCTNGTCTPDPTTLWKVRCIRADIAPTKPNGDPWDLGTGTLAAPDPQCAFWLGNSSASETSVLSNTTMPAWNESITPGSRFTASLLSSQSNPWSIRVIDDDMTSSETVCSVSPVLEPAAFSSGLATFTAGSCRTLEIGLECASQ